MSVLIRGMEMPDNCYVCPFMFHQRRAPEVWCTAIENHWLDLRKVLSCDRHNNCPLISVPEHGRLIDADALYEDCALDHNYEVAATTTCINEYMQIKIDDAPTIIQAEEGE